MKKKNIFLKICLIVLSVVLAVFAVLFFMKTRVQPPKQLTFTNQYTTNTHQLTSQLSNVTDKQLENDFQLLQERIELLRDEDLISDNEKNESFTEFINEYVTVFRPWCDRKFKASVWEETDLHFMRGRVNDLLQNSDVISSENNAKVNEVKKVLDDYNALWNLGTVKITSSYDSKKYLAEAKKYKDDHYLSNCTKVMDFLNGLNSNYQKKHFNHVKSMVNNLTKFNRYELTNLESWNSDYGKAKSAKNDYNNVASSLYGVLSDDFGLYDCFEKAKKGFANRIKEEVSKWSNEYYPAIESYEGVFGTYY